MYMFQQSVLEDPKNVLSLRRFPVKALSVMYFLYKVAEVIEVFI